MRVLVLGPQKSPLTPVILESGCDVLEYADAIDKSYLMAEGIDFIVSYRYRYIINKDVVSYMNGRIINLHISLLPWNRGSDPNLWSFLENTPKGVTIHYIDEGVDTGEIIAQKELFFDHKNETLATTYRKLNMVMLDLFRKEWAGIMKGVAGRRKQPEGGSYHRTNDKMKYEHLFAEKGWNTPVKELMGKALAKPDRINPNVA